MASGKEKMNMMPCVTVLAWLSCKGLTVGNTDSTSSH